MQTESEIIVFQKAAMYDPDKTYTIEELKKVIRAYLKGKEK